VELYITLLLRPNDTQMKGTQLHNT